MTTRAWLALLLMLVLTACVPPPVRRAPDAALLQAQAAREAALATHLDWSLSGRIAISNGEDGGSGRIDWKQHGSDFDIRLSAPVTRQSWRLVREGDRVRLEGLEGGTREGTDAQSMLYDALGWRVPVDSLAAWARGARANSDRAQLRFGDDGLPSLLTEDDWSVEYLAWVAAGDPPRPQKVFATQGEAKLRLFVDHWDSQ
ncbi:MAG TPA: lipoprotein insertase outer membrane protein LolB [Xanthomonadaceae bacterium]|nr:lipoprotein insertase outer membrane protein LolB [Xanthomonadaceae bacterium]